MKIIYLASFKAFHPNYNITYQDINGKRDLNGDMLSIDLNPYDVIIATPPCNYYSRANYRRETSLYSQKTKHLLPDILNKLIKLNKPFIVENVRNPRLFDVAGLNNLPCYQYIHGRHTYWTNIPFNPSTIDQDQEYKLKVCKKLPDGSWLKTGQTYVGSGNSQGGNNVHRVIEYWLEVVNSYV
jgi:hypothetical protein